MHFPKARGRYSFIFSACLILLIASILIAPKIQSGWQAFADEATDEPPTEVVTTDTPPSEVIPTDVPTDDPTTEAAPTEVTPTDESVVEVTATDTPPADSTDEPVIEASPSPTDSTPTDTPTDAPTPEPTSDKSMMSAMDDVSAEAVVSCQLDINDAGDANPFTFNFAATNAQGISSYSWDFGDTATDSGQNVSHTYASTGSFTITLTCVPTIGTNIVLTGSVIISSAVTASFNISPGTGGFTPYTITLTNTSMGGGLTYLWTVTGPENFSSTDTNPTFTFTIPGTYTVNLTATDGAGQTSDAQVDVIVQEAPPSADFTLSQTSGTPPLVIQVEGVDKGGGPITSWSWDYGDSSPADTGQGPHNHTYSAEGTYWIVLSYSGPGGNATVSKQVGVYSLIDNVTASYSYSLEGNVAGGTKVCFTNNSTGPIVTNEWDFGDGTTLTDNSAVVCHVFATENNYEVSLVVRASDPNINAEDDQTISVIAAPVAQISASSGSIVWADTVDFSSALSTGFITSWDWDFNNDGTIDSTDANPTGIAFNTLGSIPVTLKVTGPGGSSTAQMTIQVGQRALTCDFTGSLSTTPNQTIAYDGTLGDPHGRTITYTWTVTGPGGTNTYNTEDVSITWVDEGAYYVTFAAQAAEDGASCSKSKTVQVAYPPLTCSLTGNFTPAPNGTNYTYTANVTGLAGRTVTYKWYVDGVEQVGSTGSTFTRSWSSPTNETISFDATLANGSGCNDAKAVTVVWPNLTCSITGNNNPLPQLPDNPTRSYTYTGNVNGLAGRTATYTWYVDGVEQTGITGNQLTLSWAWDEEGPKVVTFDVVSSVTSSSCQSVATKTVNVNVPNLTCSLNGDLFPVLDENVTYSLSLGNQYGRTITGYTWDLQESDGVGGYTSILTGTGSNISYTFSDPGKIYRILYTVAVTQPDHNCGGQATITAAGVGDDFLCDGGPTGNLAPASSSANYTYQVEIDNTRAFNLHYTWVLVDSNGNERILATNDSLVDGTITSPSISGAALGPADKYTLRVDVAAVNPADTSHSCSLAAAMVVGSLNVNYTYTGNANAIEVGQQICLTNTSNTSHDDINALTYSWDFATATNSLGTQTSTAQQPGCLSYPNPGTYTITLTGTNASGLLTGSKSYTFHVYGSQSIAINRSNPTYAPASNMTFSAIPVNVSAPFNWTFRNVGTNTVLGTATGQNVTYSFLTAGTYEASVTANGPLGATTATTQFTLLAVDDIRAAFRPSAFGGLAPMHVCFTDNSVGNNMNSWSWDFGNGQTLSYTDTTIPGSICTDYTTPATAYVAKLTVTNTSSKTATAQNVIRTFNIVEANSSFTIAPQGSGRYCFQSQLDPGITVVSWEMGDGTVINGGGQSFACYTYQSSGSYLVTMNITDGTTDGSITRPLDVDLSGSNPPPSLAVTHVCAPDGSVTFTVTNNGGSMSIADRVTIFDSANTLVQSDDFLQLANGASKTYTVSGHYGMVTLKTLDTGVTYSSDCDEPPMMSGSAACAADGTAVFTILNSSSDTAANQTYEVRDGANTLVDSGTLTTAAVGGMSEVRVSGKFEPLTFTSSSPSQGSTTNVTLNTSCDEPPVLAAVTSCQIDGTAVFDITNTSSATDANQAYEIRDASNTLVYSGTLTIPANGGTQQILVSGVYHSLTLTSDGGAGATSQITATTNCDEPPIVSGTVACATDGSALFNIVNTSQDTDASQPYEIRNSAGTALYTGTLNVPANGGKMQIKVSGVYIPLTLVSSGTQGATTNLTLNNKCDEPQVAALAVTITPTPLPPVVGSTGIIGGGTSVVWPQDLLPGSGYDPRRARPIPAPTRTLAAHRSGQRGLRNLDFVSHRYDRRLGSVPPG